MDDACPYADAPALWRRLARHAAILLLIGLASALVAPTIATLLLALRANGLSFDLAYAIMLAPWAILLAGPGAFLLGLVFGWMLLGLAAQGVNALPLRLALGVAIASLAWWLAEPLPESPTQPTADALLSAHSPVSEWLTWALSAGATALVFTRGWVARRLRHPPPIPPGE